MRAALKAARQGHCAWKSRTPSAHAMRDEELAEPISQVRADVRNIYGAPKTFMRLRALGMRTSRKRVARIMRERGWRGVTRVRQKALGREAGLEARIGGGPGEAQVRGRRPQRGMVRGHRLRQDAPGLAVPGARDGHMVAPHSGLVDGAEHHGRAGRRRAEDGPGQAKPARWVRASQQSRIPIRVAAAFRDHARARHPPVDGIDIIAVGQRRHGVAHGHREVGVRARADLHHARGGGAGDPFEHIAVVCNRARIRSALGCLSPAEFEGANWPAEEGRPKAA